MRCPKCHGDKFQIVEEDNRQVSEPCFLCDSSGEVPADLFRTYLIGIATSELAGKAIEARKLADQKAFTTNPEHEGVGLIAAENGLTVSEYWQETFWKLDRQFGEALSRLDTELVEAIAACVAPEEFKEWQNAS